MESRVVCGKTWPAFQQESVYNAPPGAISRIAPRFGAGKLAELGFEAFLSKTDGCVIDRGSGMQMVMQKHPNINPPIIVSDILGGHS